jgi:hypothetical protein
MTSIGKDDRRSLMLCSPLDEQSFVSTLGEGYLDE